MTTEQLLEYFTPTQFLIGYIATLFIFSLIIGFIVRFCSILTAKIIKYWVDKHEKDRS